MVGRARGTEGDGSTSRPIPTEEYEGVILAPPAPVPRLVDLPSILGSPILLDTRAILPPGDPCSDIASTGTRPPKGVSSNI
jgi:hypothetical protein